MIFLAVCKRGLRMLIQVWMLYVYVDTYVSTFRKTGLYTCPGFVCVGCRLYLYKMDNGDFLRSHEELQFNTDCPRPSLESGLSTFLWNRAVVWKWNTKLYDYKVYNFSKRTDFFFVFSVSITWCLLYIYSVWDGVCVCECRYGICILPCSM